MVRSIHHKLVLLCLLIGTLDLPRISVFPQCSGGHDSPPTCSAVAKAHRRGSLVIIRQILSALFCCLFLLLYCVLVQPTGTTTTVSVYKRKRRRFGNEVVSQNKLWCGNGVGVVRVWCGCRYPRSGYSHVQFRNNTPTKSEYQRAFYVIHLHSTFTSAPLSSRKSRNTTTAVSTLQADIVSAFFVPHRD